jgi:hypothetical protein
MSYQSYTSDSRDANRTTSIKSAQDWLEIYMVKKSSYPNPDSPLTLTWWNTTIFQWVLWETVSNAIKLMWWIKDPKTSSYYVYSTSWNWKYYQIRADLENTVSYNSLANTVYAEWTKALVKWNYTFDPSLPSLITVTWSVNSASWIFDPNVCFVIDWWTNLVTSNSWTCTQKYKMSLKDFDSSLIAYRDMESYYQTTYDVNSNVPFIKDLSWNNYDIYPRNTTWVITSISNASWSIFTWTLTWKWIRFDNNNFNYQFSTLDYWYNASYNWRVVKHLDPDFWMNLYTSNSWWTLINWISFISIVDYEANKWVAWNNKRVISFWKLNNWLIDAGDVDKWIDSSPFRINNVIWPFTNWLHSYINAINNWTFWVSYWTRWLKWCWWSCPTAYSTYKDTNIFNWLNQVAVNMNFQNKQNCVYINWYKKFCYPLLDETIQRLQEPGYKKAWFTISSMTENFVWVIDDIKIYNRALSDSEIAQQAKIAGFWN